MINGQSGWFKLSSIGIVSDARENTRSSGVAYVRLGSAGASFFLNREGSVGGPSFRVRSRCSRRAKPRSLGECRRLTVS